MSREYRTQPTFYEDRVTQNVVQPDRKLVAALHSYLDLIPNDDHALAIDMIVSDLLKFHNPNVGLVNVQMNHNEDLPPRVIFVEKESGIRI